MRTNDYLSIASDKRIIDAERRALETYGHGDAVSRVFVHQTDDPEAASSSGSRH